MYDIKEAAVVSLKKWTYGSNIASAKCGFCYNCYMQCDKCFVKDVCKLLTRYVDDMGYIFVEDLPDALQTNIIRCLEDIRDFGDMAPKNKRILINYLL